MRNVSQVVDWYKSHTTTAQLGYNPDGMCMKICRQARGLPAVYPSALAGQIATPKAHRVTDISKIRKGMVVYYDDPRDSNPFGHIVTVTGRAKGVDRSKLESLLVRTNSVQKGRVVVVRGDYFPKHWGDSFQFAATWLNGQELDVYRPVPKEPTLGRTEKHLRAAINTLRKEVIFHRLKGNTRIVRALKRDIREMKSTIKKLA